MKGHLYCCCCYQVDFYLIQICFQIRIEKISEILSENLRFVFEQLLNLEEQKESNIANDKILLYFDFR